MSATTSSSSEPELRFWRDGALDGACLASARYGAHQFERHVHDEMVIAVTEDGAGECRTRLGRNVAGPETVWVFAPGEYHCGEVWEDRRWIYRGIYLEHDGLQSLGNTLDDGRPAPAWVPPGLYHDKHLAGLLLRAHRSVADHAPLMERQTHWLCAMNMLFSRYGQPKPRGESRLAGRRNLQRARDYIADNLSRTTSVDEVAAVCGLTRFHFMRSFAREFGLPPHAYANQLRLIAAKRLIATGHSPADAATTAGFYDQSHLTRLFRRAYGLTPGAFAKLRHQPFARGRLVKKDRSAG